LKAKVAILCLLCLVILVAGARVFYWTNMPNWQARDSRIKWKQTLPDAPSSALALGKDGTLYVATRGAVYALDPSGAVRWAYRADLYEIPSGLLLDGDENLYFFTSKKAVSLTSTGTKRWETECSPEKTFRLVQAAALSEGVVYATCGQNLVAMNTSDGRDLWRLPLFEDEPKPVVLKSGAIVSSRQWRLEAINANGNQSWNFPPPNYEPTPKRLGLVVDQPFFSSPIAIGADESLYVGSGDGEFSAFSAEGARKWTYDAGPLRGINFVASPVIASDDTVIAISTQATVYAFSPDGALKWSVLVGDPIRDIVQPTPMLGMDGTIYVLAARKLVALTSSGNKLWEVALREDSTVSPTLAPDGTLYVAASDGIIYAVHTASRGLMKSPWPKYQRDLGNSGDSLMRSPNRR
jgi:outer membrane protein assembly factor BamB